MTESNASKNNKVTTNRNVIGLVNDNKVITALAVASIIFGVAILLAKTRNHSKMDSGRYTEFDTNF
jgi:hypothetical protein